MLQLIRYLLSRSECFRLERQVPGGIFTRWDGAPWQGTHNDQIFGQFRKREPGRPFRCELDRWLRHSMGVRGIPIPYGAPNANAVCERQSRNLRERVLNHFVFLNARHLLRVLRRYVEYHNGARPSQATGRIPDPYPELRGPPPAGGKLVALPVLGGLHHDYRRAA